MSEGATIKRAENAPPLITARHSAHRRHTRSATEAPIPTHTMEIATRFVRGAIAFSRSQSWSVEATGDRSRSQASSDGEDRLNAHSARMKNTVVGITGTTMPINPSPTQRSPNSRYPDRTARLPTPRVYGTNERSPAILAGHPHRQAPGRKFLSHAERGVVPGKGGWGR